MEQIPSEQLSREEMAGLIDRLFDAFAESERGNAELVKRLENQH
jgi:hypothetical protein